MRAIWACIALAGMAQVALYAATGGGERPSTAIDADSCVTAECHVAQTAHRVLHGPVNVHDCQACHEPVDVREHSFRLTHEPTALCASCHEMDLPEEHRVHEPVETGECASCHDPHGGPDRRFLKPNAFGDACLSCHDELSLRDQRFVHGPVAAGECSGCHEPHSSPRQYLLRDSGSEMCLSCHQQMGRQMFAASVVHEPAAEDCTSCHDPHASNFPMMARAPTAELCTEGCHDAIGTQIFTSTVTHSAAYEDDACSNCHSPHATNRTALLKARPVDLCMSCHEHPIERDDQPAIASVAMLVQPGLHQHGPVEEGSCEGCHDVHGTDIRSLLVAAYPQGHYEPFDTESYGLCFSCHDAQMVQEPRLEGLTRFRDGDVNLHYVHVNQAKRGRTCRNCHDAHAAPLERIMHETVAYGPSAWELPIRFERTETGGSCSPGCHQPLAYDRLEPVLDHEDPASLADRSDDPDSDADPSSP